MAWTFDVVNAGREVTATVLPPAPGRFAAHGRVVAVGAEGNPPTFDR
jgi:hypothetical protein